MARKIASAYLFSGVVVVLTIGAALVSKFVFPNDGRARVVSLEERVKELEQENAILRETLATVGRIAVRLHNLPESANAQEPSSVEPGGQK